MIKIAEEYRYFTHIPGKESVIPLSKAYLIAYPSRLTVFSQNENCSVDLNITGPIKGFTHLLNIEKARVEVFGVSKEGYFHFFLFAEDGFVNLKLHRGKQLEVFIEGNVKELNKGDVVALLKSQTIVNNLIKEKISFGCYKKPLLENQIDRLTKLYLLSQLIPNCSLVELDNSHIQNLLIDLFSPKTEDQSFQALNIPLLDFDKFSLFSTFYNRMKLSLLREKKPILYLLEGEKSLPHSGRALSLKGEDLLIDLLWKKKKVLKLILHPQENCLVKLALPLNPKSYRIKNHYKEKGKFVDANIDLYLEKGKTLLVDRIIY